MLTLSNSQIRQGISNDTKGTAFVVYEEVMDAKQACDKLNGFNFQNRYLVGMCTLSSLGRMLTRPSSVSPAR
jgi:pre-mRNA branch site protein p14